MLLRALALSFLLAAAAGAQSVGPNGTILNGEVWTQAQWNAAFQYKVDTLNGSLTNPAIVGATIDNTSTMDCLLCTDVQSNALVGTIPAANLSGSAVRYSTTTTCLISSTDGGNIVATTYAGALATCTIPDINTNGVTGNGFQMGLLNYDPNEMLLTQAASSTINQLTSIPFAPNAGALLFADACNLVGGNCNYTAFIVGESVGPQPMYLFHDTSQSGTNISDWGLGTISGTNGQMCLYALKDGGYGPGFASGGTSVFCATRGASGTSTGQGITQITIGNAASNTSVIFQSTSPVVFSGNVKTPQLLLTGSTACATNGQSCLYQPSSNQVAIGGGAGNVANQYVLWDAYGNLNTIGAVVSVGSPPTLTPTSGCTVLSAPAGGTRTFSFSPTATSGGACAFTVTWTAGQSNSNTNGWVCSGSDNGQGTALLQTNAANHPTYVTMKTGTTTATSDLITVHCDSF
jgi:hypothetical protein